MPKPEWVLGRRYARPNSRRHFVTINRFLIISGILAIASRTSLFAQTFGEVTGHISDATGAAVPGAKIYLTNAATNAIRETLSTDSGDYTFAAVAPGTYKIRVEQASFKTTGSSNIPVQVQQTVRLDFTLEVGSVTESVEVSAAAPRSEEHTSELQSLAYIVCRLH